MFVNYVADAERPSPVNVCVARVLLGSYAVWNVLSIDFRRAVAWPVYYSTHLVMFEPPFPEVVLLAEKVALILFLLCFTVGAFERLSAAVSAVLLFHLALLLHMKTYVGRVDSLFIAGYLLVLFGLYAHADPLSVDSLRRTGSETRDDLRASLRSMDERTYDATVLKWGLLVVAVLYFGSAWAKAVFGPLERWATGWNLGRLTVVVQERLRPTALGGFVLEHSPLLRSMAVGTVLLEGGLLVAAVLHLPITLLVLGLLSMHLLIALSLGPFFFDQILFLLLFASWDGLYGRVVREDTIRVMYDEQCDFCLRSLYLFKLLDVRGTVDLRPRSGSPASTSDEVGEDSTSVLHVVRDGRTYEDYYGLRELLRQFRVFDLLVWLMDRRSVTSVGERAFSYVSANRNP